MVSELRSCVKVEVDILGSQTLIVYTVFVDEINFRKRRVWIRAPELCESRGGRPGLPVPNSPYGLCGRKPTLKKIEIYPLLQNELISELCL